MLRLEQAQEAAEVTEHTRAARGGVELVEALAADRGAGVRVQARGVGLVIGTIADVGRDWFTVDTDVEGPPRRRAVLLPLTSVQAVSGLSGFADQRPSASARRFGLRLALRALSRDRATVRVHVEDYSVLGTIDRVAQDHIDIAEHPDDRPPRRAEVRMRQAVPLWSLRAVRQL